MSLIEELSQLGADTNDALSRFMDNSELYERMVKKFPKTVEDTPVLKFAELDDIETAASNAHALKGVTGNLSLTPLYNNYTEIVKLYRNGKSDEANALLRETLTIQERFLEVINKYV